MRYLVRLAGSAVAPLGLPVSIWSGVPMFAKATTAERNRETRARADVLMLTGKKWDGAARCDRRK